MPTIKDIAREAGVSVTTVSNVIHGKSSHVAPETVERINKIMDAHHYTPNMSARALVNKSSRIIGLINHLVPQTNGNFMIDPFFSAVSGGVEREVRSRGYYLMMRTVQNTEELMSLFRNWNLDGLIIPGVFQDTFYSAIKKSGIPAVFLDSYLSDSSVLKVGINDYQGGYMATKHLIQKGHRSVVFVSPHFEGDEGVIYQRYLGYRDALKEAGITFDAANVYAADISVDSGIALGQQLAGRSDVTAVFATADVLAAGIMSGLQQKGVRVPDDKSIIGFDDVFLSQITSPRLTTIHQDADEKGALAAGLLIDHIEKHSSGKSVTLPISLVERESVRQR